jgi:ABC-type polysaccharide/polyol phosphate transport system ATPase subunit
MPGPAIRFDHVSKRYRLQRGWSGLSVRDAADRILGRLLGRARDDREQFWALRDVSFDITRGETVGLIGANGAGKSTALKILSRVTVATSGAFWAAGSIGALIEIGAGFHPDLTGRDNVFLNGSIMGMRRAEIEAKFDRIIDFSEIGQFIDTPIKYYSSGMQVRLGFAVAAHIDPDILLVDEVLAVGDAAFQAKCLNKMAELRERAKTIVLVTHNMANVVQHCDRVIWIDHGTVRAAGDPEAIVEEYLHTAQTRTAAPPTSPADDGAPLRITGVRLLDAQGTPGGAVEHGLPATIEIDYAVTGYVDDPVIQVQFQDARGHLLGALTTRLAGVKIDTRVPRSTVRLTLTPMLFTRGAYVVAVTVLDARLHRFLTLRPASATFTVEGPSVASREVSGHLVYPHRWDVEGSRT